MESIKQKNQDTIGRRRFRSSFWPLVLICIGLVWLLSNFGIVSLPNIIALLQLWPLLLIVGGLELLFGRTSPQLARVLGIGTLIFAVAFMFVAPAFGIGKTEVKTGQYTEPLGQTVTANVTLSPAIGTTTVSAATDSNNLFDANVTYAGKLNYSHAGDKDKSITLQEDNSGIPNFGFWNMWGNNANLHWDVTLNPAVPINLSVNNGIGNSTLDLSKLKLTGADISSGVGEVTLNLPATDTTYDAKINAGIGNVTVTLPTDSAINVHVSGGTGNVDIRVPQDAAVQVVVNSGIGKINLSASMNFARTLGRGNDSDGTYETSNFASATHKIVIDYNGGVGNFSIHS